MINAVKLTTQQSAKFLQPKWLIALTIWGGLTFSLSDGKSENESSGGGAMVAGCTGCTGVGAAAAVKGGAFKGCTSGGAKMVAAKVSATAATGGVGIEKTVEKAGENYLKSFSRNSLRADDHLLKEVPELQKMLSSGKSMDQFIAENPEIRFKAGKYLAEKDEKLFLSHVMHDDFNLKGVVDSKTKKIISDTTDDIVLSMETYPPPIPHDVIVNKIRLSAINNSNGGKFSISSDNGYAEIKYDDLYNQVSVKFDLVALSAGAGATAITYDIKQKRKIRSESNAATIDN